MPAIYETDDYTVKVYHDRNIRTAICERCNACFTLPEQELVVRVIWKKDQSKTDEEIIKQFKGGK